jgi:alkylhydroperoxidase family enzyme
MARVPYLRVEDLPEADRDVLQRPFHLWRALANSPATSRAFQQMVAHLWNANRLERRLVELVILQVAAVCGVPYEWVHHVRLGLQNGVSADDVRAIGPDGARGDRFGAREAAALAAAREIARDGGVCDATHARLAASFDAGERVDLAMTAATYVGVARFLAALEIDVEPEWLTVLDEHPLPARGAAGA